MESECKDALEEHQTTYLFLLVGTNPLPNYIAARLLLKQSEEKPPHLILVNSSEVGKYVDSLSYVLMKDMPNLTIHRDVQIDEAAPWKIFSGIQTKLEHLVILDSADVGLNYTGGTKAMAVSAYRAIKEAFPFAKFSYLDARSLSMIIEKPSENADKCCVRDCLEIPMETMLALHQYRYKHKKDNGKEIIEGKPLTRPKHQELACAIAKNCLITYLNQWMFDNYHCIELKASCADDLQGQSKSRKKKIIDEIVDKHLESLVLPSEGPFSCLTEFFNGAKTFGELSKKWDEPKRETAKYLDGGWLEDYVLFCLDQCKTQFNIHEIGMNLKAQAEKPESLDDHFEIDDYAIRGYQLFGISCGTGSDKSTLKLKLYEILVHTRQMGGDEARLALVCGSANPQKIERELVQDWNVPEGMIRVFGRGDIPCLVKGFAAWFAEEETKEVF